MKPHGMAMPRGGNHRPDGFSPHKHSDGRVLKILKSTNSKTLYFKVVENHKGKFYPKIAVKTAEGKTKYKMIGAGSPTAREASKPVRRRSPSRPTDWKQSRHSKHASLILF